MEMFDPTTDQADIASLLAQVAALRKQQYTAPQGQMVSGHYVAPAMSQQLQPVLGGVVADLQEGRAKEKQKDLDTRAQADLVQWLRRRPQAQTVYGAGAEGPTMNTQQPSDASMADWASAGLKNPLTKTVANQALTDNIVNAPIRAEKQADKIEIQRNVDQRYTEDREARMQLARENAQARMDQLQMRLDAAAAQGAATNGIRLQIAQQANELRRLGIEAQDRRAQAGLDAKAGAAEAKANTPKGLSATQQKQVAELASGVTDYTDLLKSYKPEYFGASAAAKVKMAPVAGVASDLSGGLLGLGDKDREMIEWHQRFKARDNPERHELFGSALTPTENASYQQTTISSMSDPKQVPILLQRRLRLEKLAIDRIQKMADGWKFNAETGEMTPPARSAPLRAVASGGANVPGGVPVTTNARGNPTQQPNTEGVIDTLLREYQKPQPRDADYASLERELKAAGYKGALPSRGKVTPAAGQDAGLSDEDLLKKYR